MIFKSNYNPLKIDWKTNKIVCSVLALNLSIVMKTKQPIFSHFDNSYFYWIKPNKLKIPSTKNTFRWIFKVFFCGSKLDHFDWIEGKKWQQLLSVQVSIAISIRNVDYYNKLDRFYLVFSFVFLKLYFNISFPIIFI